MCCVLCACVCSHITLLLVPVRDTGTEAGTMLTEVGTGPRELVLGATV